MKKKQKKELWDYYYDKQLAVLVIEENFDFKKIARIMNRITNRDEYTELGCRHRWAKIHLRRKNGKKDPTSQQILDESKPGKELTLREKVMALPEERKHTNFLKVTKEDLESAYSISAITGERITPTGTAILV